MVGEKEKNRNRRRRPDRDTGLEETVRQEGSKRESAGEKKLEVKVGEDLVSE